MNKSKTKYVGKNVLRFEDERLLNGNGQYTADINFPGMYHVAFLRSEISHGEIISIDLEEAKKLENVYGIFLYDDLKHISPIISKSNMKKYLPTKQHILCKKKIRYLGEPIAVVVAKNRYIAEDAISLINIELKELEPIIDTINASNETKNFVHPSLKTNVILERTFSQGDIKDVNLNELISIKKIFKMGRKTPLAMEPRSYVCDINKRTNELTLYSSTQVPGIIKDAIMTYLGINGNQITVIAPDVGGGFGGKASLYMEELIVVAIANKLQTPVKWVSDRYEDLLTTSQGFEEIIEAELLLDEKGNFISLNSNVYGDIGAYSIYPWTAALEPMQVAGFLQGPYKIKNFYSNVKCITSNKPPTGPYRGVGRPAAVFVIESLVDMAARKINMNPSQLRLNNIIRKNEQPYKIGSGIVWDKVGFEECLKKALSLIDYDKIKTTKKWEGVGIATYGELTGIGSKISVAPGMPLNTGSETSILEIDSTGSISATFGIASHGQGLETTLSQVVGDHLGVTPNSIKIKQGNTSLITHGTGTYASRSAALAGGAAIKVSKKARNHILNVASFILNAPKTEIEIEDNLITQKNSNKKLSFPELSRIVYSDMQTLPIKLRKPLIFIESYDPIFGASTTATHIATVKINPETFKIKIKNYVVAEDCGKVINPMIVDGQVQGGVAQGIGAALFEEMMYNENGQLETATLADYLIPNSLDVPEISISHLENFLPNNIGKFKGMGEGGTIGATGAIANAVSDALKHLNIEITELPITPNKLYTLIKNKEKK